MRRKLMARSDRSLAEGGFTLIEMLVALTLLALLLPLAFGSFRQFSTLWNLLDSHSSDSEEVQSAAGFLRRTIAQIRPATLPESSTVDFDGEMESIRFIAPLPDALQAGTDGRFGLRVTSRDGRRDLVFDWRLDWAPIGDAREVILLRDIDRLEIRYWGQAKANDAPTWRERWPPAPSLPALIDLRVTFPAGDRRVWTELVTAPIVTADIACVYDRLTYGCVGR